MYESFMRRAIALSCQGVEAGGGPFGAVVVKDGEIIGDSCCLREARYA
jgi:tRNA(Arg) A34 adenosine deaminase TadA